MRSTRFPPRVPRTPTPKPPYAHGCFAHNTERPFAGHHRKNNQAGKVFGRGGKGREVTIHTTQESL